MEHVTVIKTADVPVASIQPHPDNANRGNVKEIATRLREMGQYRTIVVHEPTGNILAGNSTYRAARDELGWTHIRAELVNCTEARAREILAWDNRARDLSLGYDQGSLLSLLSLIEGDGGLMLAGYRSDDIDDLRASLEELAGDLPELPDLPDVPISQRKSLDEMADEYADAINRMVMLGFDNAQYVWVQARLAELGERWELDTNSAVLLRLLADATDRPAPDTE